MLKKIFGKGKKNNSNTEGATKKKVKYSDALIPNLKDAHGALFQKYLEIEATFKENDEKWHTIYDMIKEFEVALKLHVSLEDRQLYTYLEQHYEDEHDTEYLEHLKELQSNMGDIMKAVNHFGKKYSDWENYKRNKHAFLDDLGAVGKALTNRVELEENFIYPMYMEGH